MGPWLFSEPMVLRGLAAGAALTAVVGAVVMRRWDASAGRRVADLARGRASDEWRHEERVAELESDLDESRELRTKLEQRLRAKRAELAGLRNEHAALLRRYATAETERATALEGRRLLEIEAAPDPEAAVETPAAEETAPEGSAGTLAEEAVPEATTATVQAALAASSAASVLYVKANSALDRLLGARNGVAAEETADASTAGDDGAAVKSGAADATGNAAGDDTAAEAAVEAVPEAAGPVRGDAPTDGSIAAEAGAEAEAEAGAGAGAGAKAAAGAAAGTDLPSDVDADAASDAESASDSDSDPAAESGSPRADAAADGTTPDDPAPEDPGTGGPAPTTPPKGGPAKRTSASVKGGTRKGSPSPGGPGKGAPRPGGSPKAAAASTAGGAMTGAPVTGDTWQEGESLGKPEAVGGHERTAAATAPSPTQAAGTDTRNKSETETETVRTHAQPVGTAQPAQGARPRVRSGPVGVTSLQSTATRAASRPAPDTAQAPEPSPGSALAGPAPAGATAPTPAARPARPAGHFTVPTAVAVAPATPVRRPVVEGGFDFFGTQKGAEALEAVQNEDLADVVGQEALALHKAESESGFKPVSEASRGVGQVIDLTAHDETEQIDLTELRSAVS
ncbi:hypothetical protein ACH4Y0_36110 [Streptomyces sp. NPDC020707]|uniref:hypothetical protein n=1 Tax=Streptomyces sp. NPDC020707 TaxID=3365084 RepID=UPI0037ACB48E